MKNSLVVAGAAACLLGLGAAAEAQAPAAAPPSTMGPTSGNAGAANNGIGTSGSLDRNAGTASSTAAGMAAAGKTDPAIAERNRGKGDKMETDPALGGSGPTPGRQ